jgi:thiol-disulfide isomerase/thioredoxin
MIARSFFLIVFAGMIAAAQSAPFSCVEPAEIRNLSLNELRARSTAGADDFFLFKRLLERTPDRPKPGTLAPLFEQKLKDHPDDPRYLYLYGRSLTGKHTPEAIRHLNRAAEVTPDFPWTYTALATIYSSPNFADGPKRLANIRLYRKLCPANLDGFTYLDSISDPTESAQWAKELRTLLEKTTEQHDGRYWRSLWAAQFRLAPKSDYDQLRAQVAEDIRRLESTPEPWKRDFLVDLATGYQLINRPEAAAKIEHRLNPDQEARKADHAFADETHWSTNLSAEQREAAYRELARRASEWVQKWPESRLAWSQLEMSLPHKPGWTKQEMEHAGEEAIKAEAAFGFDWNPTPEKLEVARQWVRYGIRPKDCIAMARETLDVIALGSEEPNDLYYGPNFQPDLNLMNRNTMFALGVIVDASLLLKDFDQTRSAIAGMEKWVIDHKSLESEPYAGFWRWRALWMNSQGKLAEAEGRRLDAIGFYTRAIAGRAGDDPEIAKHARELWDEMGGTKQAWSALTANSPVPPKPPAPLKTPVNVATQFAAWHDVGKSLAEMNLHDPAGRTWTLADFQGKMTFVTVWATWCGPCRDELPSVQKLFDLTRQQKGVQVITLNIDEDPGLVEPFLAANGYTFPVLMSSAEYAGAQTGPLSIPQNWIVDRIAILREKSSGFDDKISDWPRQILGKLTEGR